MNNALLKYKYLEAFLKEIQKLDNNLFELSKDEIIIANELVKNLYDALFIKKINKIKLGIDEKDYIENIDFKDKTFIEDFEELLRDFNLSIDLDSSKAFDELDEFIYKFKKVYRLFLDNVRFRKMNSVKLGVMYYSEIEAIFDFQLNLIKLTVDYTDYTNIINEKLPYEKDNILHSNYHRAKRNYHQLLKELKVDLGIDKSKKELEKEIIVNDKSFLGIYTSSARVKEDGYFNSKDIHSRTDKIVELTDLKKQMLKEYKRKKEDFEKWKEEFEKNLFDSTYGLKRINEVKIDDEVYMANSQRLYKTKITNIKLDNENLIISYKKIDNENILSKKEKTITINQTNYLPFYLFS